VAGPVNAGPVALPLSVRTRRVQAPIHRTPRAIRVVDASRVPTVPRADIHLAVLMMAERIASWI